MELNDFISEISLSEKRYYTKEEILFIAKKYTFKESKIARSKGIEVNLDTYITIHNGVKRQLPRKVTLLLHYLMSNPGKVLTRYEILSRVWGDDVIVEDRTIDVHIRKIRKLLTQDCIETVKGVGYKW